MIWGALLYGVVNSIALALMALGFNLTFGISGIANFSYGAMYVFAGYGTWMLFQKLGAPLFLSIPMMVFLTGLTGAIMYRLVLVRLRGLVISEVIATFGIGLAALELFRFMGLIGFEYTLPVLVDGSIQVGPFFLDLQRAFIIVCGILLTAFLWVFTRYSPVGLAFRGMAQDEYTALCLGIDTDKVAMLAMGLGGGLCALAAVVILPLGTISVDAGYDVLLEALAVCIVGGLGSAVGMVVASFILGMAQSMASMFMGSHWMMIVNLVAILVILAARPSGLLGKQKELEERI
jgi:branched-chain amino acid transport system permease protein